MGLGRVEDSWTNVCCTNVCCMKSISQMGKMYSGRLWIWKRLMILSVDIVCGAKSVWSWRKIVESSAEFLCR